MTVNAAEKEFVITRSFSAPRSLVWKAWTELEHFSKWWGPTGFELINCSMDLRPGGRFHYCMRAPNGMEMWGLFTYQEIVPEERIVFHNSFSNPQGGIDTAPWEPRWPKEVRNVMTLTEEDGMTTLHLRGAPLDADEVQMALYLAAFESMNMGFGGTFDQLDDYLHRMNGKDTA